MDALAYQFLNHIDAPKRVLSLTFDELFVAGLGFLLLVVSNHKFLSSLLSFSLLTILRRLKKGQGPKSLLVFAYWYLPHGVVSLFLPKLPPSYQRLWMA